MTLMYAPLGAREDLGPATVAGSRARGLGGGNATPAAHLSPRAGTLQATSGGESANTGGSGGAASEATQPPNEDPAAFDLLGERPVTAQQD